MYPFLLSIPFSQNITIPFMQDHSSRLTIELLYFLLLNWQLTAFLNCSNHKCTYFNFSLQKITQEKRLTYTFCTVVNASLHKVYFCCKGHDTVDARSSQSGRAVRHPSLQDFCPASHSVPLQ